MITGMNQGGPEAELKKLLELVGRDTLGPVNRVCRQNDPGALPRKTEESYGELPWR